MKFRHTSGREITLERTAFLTEVTQVNPDGHTSMIPMKPVEIERLLVSLHDSDDWTQA